MLNFSQCTNEDNIPNDTNVENNGARAVLMK